MTSDQKTDEVELIWLDKDGNEKANVRGASYAEASAAMLRAMQASEHDIDHGDTFESAEYSYE
jgi:hypothetical protein